MTTNINKAKRNVLWCPWWFHNGHFSQFSIWISMGNQSVGGQSSAIDASVVLVRALRSVTRLHYSRQMKKKILYENSHNANEMGNMAAPVAPKSWDRAYPNVIWKKYNTHSVIRPLEGPLQQLGPLGSPPHRNSCKMITAENKQRAVQGHEESPTGTADAPSSCRAINPLQQGRAKLDSPR